MTNLDPQVPDKNKAATLNLSWEKDFTVICIEINDIFCYLKMPPTIYAEEFCLKAEMRNWAIWSAKSSKYKIFCMTFWDAVHSSCTIFHQCRWGGHGHGLCVILTAEKFLSKVFKDVQWAEQDLNQMIYCVQCWIRHQEPVSSKPNLVLLSCDAHVHAGWREEDFVWGQMVGLGETFMKKGCLGHIYRLHRCCWGNQFQFDFQIIRSYSRIL